MLGCFKQPVLPVETNILEFSSFREKLKSFKKPLKIINMTFSNAKIKKKKIGYNCLNREVSHNTISPIEPKTSDLGRKLLRNSF